MDGDHSLKDFTLKKYTELIKAISKSEYKKITFKEYFTMTQPQNMIIIRHDIDKLPENALKLAVIESSYGINATYYFRTIKKVFIPEIIKEIAMMGHEIGYHYETMSQANGNLDYAYFLFCNNLNKLREIAEISTICMHGSSFSKYDNRLLWKNFEYRSLGILGEPYLDLNYKNINYFSDTGGTWKDFGQRTRDIIQSDLKVFLQNTDDLIGQIKSLNFNKAVILMHPDRWNDNIIFWNYEFITKNIKNFIKLVYNQYRKKSFFL